MVDRPRPRIPANRISRADACTMRMPGFRTRRPGRNSHMPVTAIAPRASHSHPGIAPTACGADIPASTDVARTHTQCSRKARPPSSAAMPATGATLRAASIARMPLRHSRPLASSAASTIRSHLSLTMTSPFLIAFRLPKWYGPHRHILSGGPLVRVGLAELAGLRHLSDLVQEVGQVVQGAGRGQQLSPGLVERAVHLVRDAPVVVRQPADPGEQVTG